MKASESRSPITFAGSAFFRLTPHRVEPPASLFLSPAVGLAPAGGESSPYLTGEGAGSAGHRKDLLRTAVDKGAKRRRIFLDICVLPVLPPRQFLFVRRVFAWQIAAFLPVITCILSLLLLPKAAIGCENM